MRQKFIFLLLTITIMTFSAHSITISGSVVNRQRTAIADATVTLQPEGITAITDSEGKFTFEIGTASKRNTNQERSARNTPVISNGHLYLNFDKQTTVTIQAFSLQGRTLATSSRLVPEGKSPIDLPCRSAGVKIYRIQAGTQSFVIKNSSFSAGGGLISGARSYNYGKTEQIVATSENPVPEVFTVTVTKDGFIDNSVTIPKAQAISSFTITTAESEGVLTDIDGNNYQTIRIGNQIWTVENLRTTRYNDGEPIPLVTDTNQWGNFDILGHTGKTNGVPVPQFCYYNNTTSTDTIKKFGALYNWYVVKTGKLAPEGWRVPDTSDWFELRNYLLQNPFQAASGSEFELVVKSLAAGIYWNPALADKISTDFTANNLSGFSAIPAGYRTGSSMILYMFAGERGYWWSSTEKHPECPCWFTLYDFLGNCDYLSINSGEFGASVRLVKDVPSDNQPAK